MQDKHTPLLSAWSVMCSPSHSVELPCHSGSEEESGLTTQFVNSKMVIKNLSRNPLGVSKQVCKQAIPMASCGFSYYSPLYTVHTHLMDVCVCMGCHPYHRLFCILCTHTPAWLMDVCVYMGCHPLSPPALHTVHTRLHG